MVGVVGEALSGDDGRWMNRTRKELEKFDLMIFSHIVQIVNYAMKTSAMLLKGIYSTAYFRIQQFINRQTKVVHKHTRLSGWLRL